MLTESPSVSRTSYRPRALFLGITGIILIGFGKTHAASTDSWTGATNASWSSSNWSGGNNPPASGDTLVFGATTGAGGTTLVDNLMTPGTFNVAGITFASGAAAFIINPNAGTNGFTLTGAITNSSTSLETINDLLTLSSGNKTITLTTGGGNLKLGGNISGAGGLSLSGAGTLILSGSNSYTGATQLTGNAGALVLSVTNFNGLSASSAMTIQTANTLQLRSDTSGTYTVASLSVSGGPGAIIDVGNNGGGQTGVTLYLGGNLNFSTNPTFNVTSANNYTLALTGTATVNNATTFNPTTGNLNIGNVSLVATNSIILSGSGSTNFVSGTISTTGSAGITVNGTSVSWTLTGSNTFSGGVTLTSGTLIAANTGALGTAATQTLKGGTLDLKTDASINAFNIFANNADLTIISDKATPNSAGITHALNTGSFQNNHVATFMGGANVSSGTAGISFTSIAQSGAYTYKIVNPANGGVMQLSIGSFNNNGNAITFTGNGNLVQTGVWSGGGGITFDSNYTGTAIFSQANINTGTIGINGGKVLFNGNNSGATGAVSVNAGGTIRGTGTIGGAVSVAGGTSAATRGTLDLTDGAIGTLTIGTSGTPKSLTLGSPAAQAQLGFEIGNAAPDMIAINGSLILNSGGALITITQLPSTTVTAGIYNLMTFSSATYGGSFSLSYPTVTGAALTLINSGTAVQLKVALYNSSSLQISPAPISLGDVLVGKTAGSGTATLANIATGTMGDAEYNTSATGAVTVTPLSSAGNGGSGATLSVGGTQALTVTGNGAVGATSGTGVVVGTVSAQNTSNPINGSAAPVNVVVNVYDSAIATPNGLAITNTGTGSNGANSLVASAKVQTNTLVPALSQNASAWTTFTPSTAFAPGNSVTLGSFNGTGLLNGTYHATSHVVVDSVTSSGSAIAGGAGSALNTSNYVMTATVSGNKSSSRTDRYEADIADTYAGYGIGSSVPGSTHTNTGPVGGASFAVLGAGGQTPSNTDGQLFMSFDKTPVSGPDTTRASDILTLQGIIVTGQGDDNRLFSDVYVLEMSYDQNGGGLAYIVQNTGSGWINAVALNQSGSLTDDGGANAIPKTFEQYLLDNGGVLQGDYGYGNGVAWAVLDHTANGVDGLANLNTAEFAVVAAVPEPGTYALLIGGAAVLAAFQKRKRSEKRGMRR